MRGLDGVFACCTLVIGAGPSADYGVRTPFVRPSTCANTPSSRQVLAVNALLIAATVVVAASTAAPPALRVRSSSASARPSSSAPRSWRRCSSTRWLLRRRFAPLRAAASATMERVDLARARRCDRRRRATTRARSRACTTAFNRMLARLEAERARTAGRGAARPGGRARADRPRPARRGQPGADRRPAAPAGDRPDAPPELRAELRETQNAATQAMEELLPLARELRPSALDDHGLERRAALAGRRVRPTSTGHARRRCASTAELGELGVERAARRLPRRPGVAVNVAAPRAAPARCASSSTATAAAPSCASPTTAAASCRARPRRRPRPHRHARARACWPAAGSTCAPRPGEGTTIELRLGAA